MPTATDDSGPAAMVVTNRLAELRKTCDRMDIKWHWRHKESTLTDMVAQAIVTAPIVHEAVESAPELARERREIPQDVKEALDYCDGYHRGNTKRIRAYIEEIR